MPTYEYRCEKCGHEFSRIEAISSHGRKKPSCPRCKSAQVSQLFSPSYVKTVRKS